MICFILYMRLTVLRRGQIDYSSRCTAHPFLTRTSYIQKLALSEMRRKGFASKATLQELPMRWRRRRRGTSSSHPSTLEIYTTQCHFALYFEFENKKKGLMLTSWQSWQLHWWTPTSKEREREREVHLHMTCGWDPIKSSTPLGFSNQISYQLKWREIERKKKGKPRTRVGNRRWNE